MITIDPPSSSSAHPSPDVNRPALSVNRPALPLNRPALLRGGLTRFLKRAQAAVGLVGEVSVLLTDDVRMRELNRGFRGKRKTTDVLSFPAMTMPGLPAEHQHAGDLAISLEVAARQAAAFGHTVEVELRVLLLHGLLHLAGFDHEVDAGEMQAREMALRGELKLPSGLIERADTGRVAARQTAKAPAAKRGVRA